MMMLNCSIPKYIIILFICVASIFCCTYNSDTSAESFVENRTTECSNITRDLLMYKLADVAYEVFRLLIYQVNITNIKKDIFPKAEMHFLQNLTIKDCNVLLIEKESFEKLSNLQYLYITDNNLTQFNGNILSLRYLRLLDLSNNNIQYFNLTKNKRFNQYSGDFYFVTLLLNNNNFSSLTNNNFYINCKGLNTLKIQNSKIKYIEPGILSNLPALKLLDLSKNYLQKLETQTFLGLTNLETLDLNSNEFNEIPSNIHNIKNLKNLNLQKNTISQLPCKLFKKTKMLHKLDLSNNKINDISICAFEFLNQLTTLNLQQNNLTDFEIGTFSGLHNLQELNLSYNKINHLEETVIHPLEKLENIDISANQFTNLNPVSLLEHLKYLRQIDLSGNIWNCYNLTSTRKYLKSRNIQYESKILNYEEKNIGGIQCYTNVTNNEIKNNSFIFPVPNYNEKIDVKYYDEIVNQIRNLTQSHKNIEINLQKIVEELEKITKENISIHNSLNKTSEIRIA